MSISPEKHLKLLEKMASLNLKESDLEEKFVRSSGKGGQKTNKSSTCVYLKHLPSGLEVKCQISREQAINRFLARRILAEKLEERILGRKSAARQAIEKLRRQKRRRSRRAREKLLADKRKHSEKKQSRRGITANDGY